MSTINNACSSGTDAVGQAAEWIEEGLCDAVIAGGGYGCSADAHHMTAPHPDGAGLERALRQALAGRDPAGLSHVNAHGTATIPNDAIEGTTLARVFGAGVRVVGTKSYTGHALGASGALEAVFAVQGLRTGAVPATAGFRAADPACAVVPTRAVTAVPRTYAVSTSLAFGGGNSAVLFEVLP